MKERIGIGIIGAGFMGMLHARVFSQLPDAFIAGVSDPVLKEAPEIPGLSKPVAFYSDHNKLLESEKVDAVVVATPEDLHRDVCLELIGDKGSIYLDYRPMSLTGVDDEGWKFPDTLHWPVLHGEVVGDILEEDRYFLKVVQGGRDIISTGQDGKNALEIVLAAKRSYKEGRQVKL